MVRDQAAEPEVGVLGVAKVASTIERVKPRVGKVRRVSDVVQPSGGFEQIGVVPEDRSEGASLRGDTLDVSPATRERDFEELACKISGPGCLAHDY
jgi:hypothetical protein